MKTVYPCGCNQRRSVKPLGLSFLLGLVIGWSKFCPVSWPTSGSPVETNLGKTVRIFCWVMTQPANHARHARLVKETWGRRCNKLVFISSVDDAILPAFDAHVPEGRQHLWGKTRFGFRKAYEYLNDFDWFYKADDDTFAIMENMRHLLKSFNPDEPLFFGNHLRRHVRHGYMSGGAGYVLSREAVRRFVEQGLDKGHCTSRNTSFAEDVEMGRCMQKLKIPAGDSRDSYKRNRFLPFHPSTHLAPSLHRKLESSWYWKTAFYPEKEGPECCSNYAISFHYIKPEKMLEMDYMIYRLRPYGHSI